MADKNYKLSFGMTDGTTKAVTFTAPQGPKGETGATGKDGQDYVLTAADKAEIAEQAAALVEVPEGGGGGAVQADLAENDPNAAGYVKNRTHYSELVDAVLFPEQTITIANSQCMNPGLMGLVVGETYTVVWEGVSYTCVAENNVVAGSNIPCIAIGNHIFVGGANNNMPFAAADISGMGVSGFMAMVDGNYTVSITGKKEIVHQLPAKYSNEFRVYVMKVNGSSYMVITPLAEIDAAIEAGRRLYIIVENYFSNGRHDWQRFDMTQASYNKQYLSEAASMEHYFVFACDVLEDDLTTYRKYMFVIANFNGGDQLSGAAMSVQKTDID